MSAQAELTPQEEAQLRRDWRTFTTLVFLFAFGFSVYMGVFQNFLRDQLHADELDLGMLESIREVPGLLAALLAGTVYALAESRVAGLGMLITGIGIGLTGVFHRYTPVVLITVFWSIGYHLWATVQSAITLSLAKGKEGGRHLGRMSGIAALATISALGSSWAVSRLFPAAAKAGTLYPIYFAASGVLICTAAVLCMRLSTQADGAKRQPFIFRREYGLYYLLAFLEGCRRQIFAIFASFALIIVYHQPVENMLLLQFINSIMIAFTAPRIGRIVDRVGERRPLTFYAIGLIVVFLGYATWQNVWALYALFLIDNVLFSFGVGFTTYLHRIVRTGELTPCLAMGTTMNHIAAVTVPVGGALLWKSTGNYQVPFWVGVAIAAIALVATRWLPKGPRQIAARP
ncbi:MAG: MFS transporter [Fimbriimonas sp.]